MTEKEYEDYIHKKAEGVKTKEDLDKLVDEIINCKELDNRKVVHALSACMDATLNYINHSDTDRTTDFRPYFAGWEKIKEHFGYKIKEK